MVELGSIQSLSAALASIYVFITACRCSDVRISVGLSHNVTHPGDNVTLTCRVQGAQTETAVVWEKLPVTGTEVEREIIGRDDQLTEDYRKLTNYDIFVIELPHVVLSILTINNVGLEESGLIGCSISVEDAIYRETTLFQVFKQPSDIWCSCEQCTVDSEINATEDDTLLVQCIVRRVQPLPHISAHLGPKNLSGHLRMTNWTTNVHCGQQRFPASGEESTDVKHCSVHFDYDVPFRLTNHLVSYLDDGRELTIAVTLGHSGWPATVKRLPVNVRYAPKLNCSNHGERDRGSNPTDAEFHSRSFVITCRLRSNPALLSTPVVWWRHLHQGNRTLHVGQNFNGYELREKGTSVQGKSGAVTYTLELIIHETQTHDFHAAFHFYAQNEVGSTTQTIRLRQITTTTSKFQGESDRKPRRKSEKTRKQPTASASEPQPVAVSSGRIRNHHTRKPSVPFHLISEATAWTIHPIICAASMTSSLVIRFL